VQIVPERVIDLKLSGHPPSQVVLASHPTRHARLSTMSTPIATLRPPNPVA
jgi:hypothetical protein